MIDRHATRGVYWRVTPAVLGWEDRRVDDIIPWLHQQLDAEEADCRYNEDMSVDAGWNPRRVLGVVQAHRAILNEHSTEWPGTGFQYCRVCQDRSAHEAAPSPCLTVRLLALAYAHRPGYQESWRP